MPGTIRTAALVAAAAVTASAVSAQVNLTSNAAGAGTTAGLTASARVECAADRGIANVQLKDGQTGTNYILALAEGKIDIANGFFILPFMLTRAAGPYASLGKEKGAEIGPNVQLLYPFTFSIFTMYAYDAKGVEGWHDLKGRKVLNGPPPAERQQRTRVRSSGSLAVRSLMKTRRNFRGGESGFLQPSR